MTAAARRRFGKARILGWALMALWIIAAVVIGWKLITEFADYREYLPKLFRGLGVTLQLIVLSLLVGAIFSVPVAAGRMSRRRLFSLPAYLYVYFFRGTPLIAQTFLVYYGAGAFREELTGIHLWWFFRDAFNCAIFVFSLNTAAYQAEILRGAIQNVPAGQFEAGRALGLPRVMIFLKIIAPQMLILALRPYGNEIILMIKGSAIASIVTVFDLMGETRRLFSRTFDYNTYILAALMYLFFVELLRRCWEALERRLTRHLTRR